MRIRRGGEKVRLREIPAGRHAGLGCRREKDSRERARFGGPRFGAGWAGWSEQEKENGPRLVFSFGNKLGRKIGLEFEFEYFSNSNFTQINSK
jgi:hypothetical protein